jgi:hypothetical protein
VFVDVADPTARAIDGALELVLERGFFRERFGRMVIQGAPAGAVVVVDGQLLPADGVLRAGPHHLHIEAPGHAARDLQVSIAGDLAVDGSLTAVPVDPPATDLLWAWPAASGVVTLAALAVGTGLDVHLANEQLRANNGDSFDVDGYRILEGLELGSFVVAGLAAASAVVGAVVVFGDDDDDVSAP